MKTIIELNDIRQERQRLPEPVGLVPTMGYLHEGHLSLARTARSECASVIATIFVNPSQFAPSEDLASYPRDLERDLLLLEKEGVDLVWTPTTEIMYPTGYQTWVTVEKVTQVLEGKQRPAHFRGVATIVAKLFNATQPHKAYFGQKDAQQALVIQRMVADLNFPLQVVVCPTVREADGLAMSSRNVHLDPQQRKAASVLFRALSKTKKAYLEGQRDANQLRRIVQEMVNQEPLASLQYVSCADALTLEELQGSLAGPTLLSMAVFFGKTRLIDNIVLIDDPGNDVSWIPRQQAYRNDK
jgi:pantoate--beta-alanine ligase